MTKPEFSDIEAAINTLLQKRGPEKSACPGEVARMLAGDDDWRSLMVPVRQVAQLQAVRGEIVITQRGVVVDPNNFKGPVRLRLPLGPEPASVQSTDENTCQ